MAVCNRKVKGSDLVYEHESAWAAWILDDFRGFGAHQGLVGLISRGSLGKLFPMEAPSLLSYVETAGSR